MIMTLTKHYGNRNAAGSRLELDPMTEAEVAEFRAACKRDGFREGAQTRKLTDAQLAAKTQKGKAR